MRRTLAAGVLLLALLLAGCGTTVVRPTIGEPASGITETRPATTAPATAARETTLPPATAAETEAPTTAAETEEPTTQAPASTAGQEEEQKYILNTKSRKFHRPDCGSVKTMKPENKAEFTGTRDELTEKGYEPCGNCKP